MVAVMVVQGGGAPPAAGEVRAVLGYPARLGLAFGLGLGLGLGREGKC